MWQSNRLVWGLLELVLLLTASVLWIYRQKRLPLPPGPPGLPFIGNVLQMPVREPWYKFMSWGQQYGDVIFVSIFGQPTLILNSTAAVDDLLDKRSSVYSDRPTMPMAGEMLGYDASVPLAPYGKRFRTFRRLLHEVLGSRKGAGYYDLEENYIRKLLVRLLESPDDLMKHLEWSIASVVFMISHGYLVADKNDYMTELASRALHEWSLASVPGQFIVDFIPWLRHLPDWFPGTSFKRTAREWRKTMAEMRDVPYDTVKANVMKGTALPSFTASLITRNRHPTAEEEDIYKWVSASLFAGGLETIIASMVNFMLAMILFPEVQKKAQVELDAAVGSARLPIFSDRKNLPYICRIVQEVWRWRPVSPLAVPHRLAQDDVYRGYLIPSGAIILANTWGILHNPDMYPDPDRFDPDRYITQADSDSRMPVNPDPRWAFGYGRRFCPGKTLAEDFLFIFAARTLAVFDLQKPCDSNGVPFEPRVEYSSGVVSQPLGFHCKLSPRSINAEHLLRDITISGQR